MHSAKSFSEEFDYFITKISNNENFAFTRFADGERSILENKCVYYNTQAYVIDKWSFNNNKIFSEDLLKTSKHREHNYYYAISCKCCEPDGLSYYKNLLDNHNITFSNLFINANYKKFINFTKQLKRKVVIIANKNCLTAEYPFEVLQKIPIEDDCVNWYEKNKQIVVEGMKVLANKYNNTLFFISAGPLSEILIHNLYINNANNCYIDVGSSLDVYTHKKITRPYQIKNSEYEKKECIF